jgi:Ca2+-binding EF-hand superfamily protein
MARRGWGFVMLLALGAASSAIDVLKSLTSSKSSSAQSKAGSPAGLFDSFSSSPASTGLNGGGGGGAQISPETMSALLAAQSQPSTGTSASTPTSRSESLKNLFSQIDGDGDGKITKLEFEDALGAGGSNLPKASEVFGKLDKDGDGSISLNELASALKGSKGRHHHHAAGSGENGSNTDPLMQALQGASSTSVTNSDGSVTTSLTYADGSKVTMTSAASGSSSSAATSSYNFIEQMIQRQAQAISASSTASLSVSA